MTPYYSDDLVTLYHGDCREVADWLDADVLVTDPPYGRGWHQGRIGDHALNEISRSGIAGDKDTTTRDAVLALWGTERPAIAFGDLMLAPPAGTKLVGVYRKPGDSGQRGAIAGLRRDAEAIYLIGGWPSGWGGRSSLFVSRASLIGGSQGIVSKAGGHPHTKPADVMAELLGLCPHGVIADPFAGGGSTLVAAKAAGRVAIGVEEDERWCERAARRLAQDVLDFGEAS